MALNVYRRHRRHCFGGHPEDASSSLLQERAKGWKRCDCDVHVSGTLAGRYARKSTGTADWDEARLVVDRLERAGSWTAEATPAPPAPEPTGTPAPALTAPPAAAAAPTPAPAKPRCAITDALQVFVTHKIASGIKPATIRPYRTFKKQVSRFAAEKGYQMIDEFTALDIDLFWATWKLGPRAKGNRLTTLRGFFRFCVYRKWLIESPVSPDIKPPVGASLPANKAPFTDDELDRILAACDGLHVAWKNETGDGEWTGDDLKDLIWLMIHTGYRISDATFFDITRLLGNQIFIRATKNGADVFAYLPNWLCARLRARAARCGPRPFLVGRSRRLESVTNTWRRRLAKAFAIAGPFEEPATPHRFRHTFARLLLQKGVSVRDVADLLGDDEATVRRHYARWVPERQDRLTQILKAALEDQAPPSPPEPSLSVERPRLLVIQGGRR